VDGGDGRSGHLVVRLMGEPPEAGRPPFLPEEGGLLATAERHGDEIELVVSDIVMPWMGGAKLVDRLRERLPEVPIILMSGHPEEELTVGVPHRATGFLEKPFSPEARTGKIREVLGR
jgi:DNA-binding NtrC family response regulator